jgi:hypothetical protein
MKSIVAGILVLSFLNMCCANTSNSNVAVDSTGTFNNASNNTTQTDTIAKAGNKGPTNPRNQSLSSDSAVGREKGNNGTNTTNGVNGNTTPRATSDRGKR